MSYDSALITTAAEVAHLVGRQQLNLVESAGFTLATFLLGSHRWVYRRLKALGITPEDLANQAHLNAAVAFHAVALLVGGGHLEQLEGADAAFYMAQAEREVMEFVPTYAASQAQGRQAGESLPQVGNHEDGTWHQLEQGAGPFTWKRTWPRRS